MIISRAKRIGLRWVHRTVGNVRFAEWGLRAGWLSRNKYYDVMTDEIMRRSIPRDGVCIDVGCHTGAMLRTMVKLAPEGRHLAFEPLPCFQSALRAEFAADSVKIFDIALSNVDEQTTFRYVVSRPAFSGLRDRSYPTDHETIEEIAVRTRRLDDIVREERLNRIDFVKIDVEGAERLVFEGARGSLSRFRPTVAFECGLGGADHYGTKPEDVFDLFADCGLAISGVMEFVHRRREFSRREFCEQFESGLNYFFVGHCRATN